MLTVIIITKNEELNIKRCLTAVQWAEEIIVVDSGSTDRTVSIAQQYTNKVYVTDWQGYGIQKQRALAYASCDWVLNIDADEEVDSQLQQAIIAAIKSNAADAYRIPIQMYFYGKPLWHSSSPTRHVRLFRRSDASFSASIVHEQIILPANAKIGRIKAVIKHHSFKDLSHALDKINKYSSYSAKIYLANNKPKSLPVILCKTTWMFLRCFILQRGFLDGRAGFLFAIFNAQGTFYRGMKQFFIDK